MAIKTTTEGALWKHWLAVSRRRPKKVVVIDAPSGVAWTAEALTEEALRLGGQLQSFREGERVAFRVPNGATWLALFLALQKGRLAAIPLDGGLPEAACHDTAQRLGAKGLFLEEDFRAVGGKITRSKNVCCIKLTSGSDALPKAVACREAHLIADGRQIISTMKIRPRDINLGVIPLGHSYGLGNLVMPLILQGTTVVCASQYVPRQIIEWVTQYHATIFPAVPALFRVLAALPAGEGTLGSLRTPISAGAVLAPEIAQAFYDRFGRKIHNFYGSSETGGICYDRTGTASLTGRSVGQPMDGVKVTVKARGITVSSKAVATSAGRWKLNDYGEWNAKTELVLLGRAGNGANIGGKKVHPIEVERVLRTLPGVTDASVWLAQSNGRDLLAAAIETSYAQTQIEEALAARLPAWKLPRQYVVMREFPRTARGKTDVTLLRARAGTTAG